MQATQDNYPVFEANQVLTNAHLNQVFDYLDEQERLTRANLIGIGIVCGLTIRLDDANAPAEIVLGKGCGITSEGYLIVEPDELALVAYRDYQLPDAIAYPAFIDGATSKPYPLWELFPAGEAETTALSSPAGFLNDKAVVLFLELKKAALRNCSPNNCDDKGAGVAVGVRRLLIRKDDLDAVIAAGAAGSESTLEASLAARLNLPDLRLPRFDAPNTQPVSSNDVLAAFLKVFGKGSLSATLADALTSAYQAFRPLLQSAYPANPFAGFAARFGFLDNAPESAEQVRFLPYYYDLFDDLIRAYDEFRLHGLDLLCACCPSEQLFPRHLMLGLLFPASDSEAAAYRQRFLASSAIVDCEQRSHDVVLLFRRLVEMVERFTDSPTLPKPGKAAFDPQIRITPSIFGAAPLSEKAIPYYYQQTGTPPLYRLWNPEKSKQNKANQNLSYRADEYTPAAPAFVTESLAYDLEAYNFLRIEGHLGKEYRGVLSTLLTLKAKYRLPIDIVALRTGDFDESIPISLSKETCRFQDLAAQYDVIRGQCLCALVQALTYFYNLPYDIGSPVTTPVPSQFAVINQYAPGFLVQPHSLGREFEDYITQENGVVPDFDAALLASWINIFPPSDFLIYYSFFFLLKLADSLPEDLADVDFADVQTRYDNLFIIVGVIENKREQGVANLEGNTELLNWEEIDDRLEDLLKNCQADALDALKNDYAQRIRDLKKKQFLSNFLSDHPGIQHKAGVPLGGTFILVYHQDPIETENFAVATAAKPRIDPFAAGALLPMHITAANLGDFVYRPADINFIKFARDTAKRRAFAPKASDTGDAIPDIQNIKVAKEVAADAAFGSAKAYSYNANQSVQDAIQQIQGQPSVHANPELQKMLEGLLTLLPATPMIPGGFNFASDADNIIAATVDDLPDGAVIADFYLPYLCCSGCAPIQFVLPKPPPTFTVAIGCTSAQSGVPLAAVTVTAKGGTPPYRIKIDDQDYQNLDNPVLLSPGAHDLIVQDTDDNVSEQETVTIPDPIRIGEPEFTCGEDGLKYVATIPISGGTPPYTVNDTTLDGTVYTSEPTVSDADLPLRIVDRNGCVLNTAVSHACPPPCDLPDQGLSRRCAYRLWLRPADEFFRSYQQTSTISFIFNGQDIDLGDTRDLLQMSVEELNSDFHGAFARVIGELNNALNNALGESFERLILSYEPADTDPFGLFWIEHFTGDTFSFSFDFAYSNINSQGNLSVRYGNNAVVSDSPYDGAIFTNFDLNYKQTRVPAFDCSSRDRCANTDFVKTCQGFDLIPAFTSKREGEILFVFSITETMPTNGIAAWVWDFTTNTTEAFYVGATITVDWQPGGYITLTAISETGCFSSFVKDNT